MTAHLWPFLVLSAILIVVPGPDMALVARNALVGGRRAGTATSAARAGDVLRRSRIRRALEGVTGTVLVAFGLRLATERR